MLIDGNSATKSSLVYHGMGCYRNRQKSYNREQFCFGEREYDFNIWGCKKLNMPIYEWGGGWLEHGALDKHGVWHFDKAKIRHHLDLAIHENALCPVLDRKRIMEILEKLPDSIDPKKNKNWEYRTTCQEINGEFVDVAVGIKPILKRVNCYIPGDFQPKWENQETENQENPPPSPQPSSHDTDFNKHTIQVNPAPLKTKKKMSKKKIVIIIVILLFLALRLC